MSEKGNRAARGETRAVILAALAEHESLTGAEMAHVTGLTRSAINGSLTIIRQVAGVVRIVGWRRSLKTKGRPAPIYALGPGQDMPCPPPLPAKERHARHREKNRALLYEKSRARAGHAPNPYLQLLKG